MVDVSMCRALTRTRSELHNLNHRDRDRYALALALHFTCHNLNCTRVRSLESKSAVASDRAHLFLSSQTTGTWACADQLHQHIKRGNIAMLPPAPPPAGRGFWLVVPRWPCSPSPPAGSGVWLAVPSSSSASSSRGCCPKVAFSESRIFCFLPLARRGFLLGVPS